MHWGTEPPAHLCTWYWSSRLPVYQRRTAGAARVPRVPAAGTARVPRVPAAGTAPVPRVPRQVRVRAAAALHAARFRGIGPRQTAANSTARRGTAKVAAYREPTSGNCGTEVFVSGESRPSSAQDCRPLPRHWHVQNSGQPVLIKYCPRRQLASVPALVTVGLCLFPE